MRDLIKNTKALWYALYIGKEAMVDKENNFTGEYKSQYSEPVEFRANISPAKGNSEMDAFGASLDYSKTISTANMNLPIDEHSLIWDSEPEKNAVGTTDFEKAEYKVVAVAKGLYHVKYAIKKLQQNEV